MTAAVASFRSANRERELRVSVTEFKPGQYRKDSGGSFLNSSITNRKSAGSPAGAISDFIGRFKTDIEGFLSQAGVGGLDRVSDIAWRPDGCRVMSLEEDFSIIFDGWGSPPGRGYMGGLVNPLSSLEIIRRWGRSKEKRLVPLDHPRTEINSDGDVVEFVAHPYGPIGRDQLKGLSDLGSIGWDISISPRSEYRYGHSMRVSYTLDKDPDSPFRGLVWQSNERLALIDKRLWGVVVDESDKGGRPDCPEAGNIVAGGGEILLLRGDPLSGGELLAAIKCGPGSEDPLWSELKIVSDPESGTPYLGFVLIGRDRSAPWGHNG